MPSFDVRPIISITNGNDVQVAANLSFKHADNTIHVRLSDALVKNAGSLEGLAFGVCNGRLSFSYDVANHAPRTRLSTHLNVKDKTVNLKYRHHLKANVPPLDPILTFFSDPLPGADASIEASLAVDDANTAGLAYDLTAFSKPDHRSATLMWTHRSGDLEVTPSYNLGTESAALRASYRVDAENALRVGYCMNTNAGILSWTNTSGAGGGGALRVSARANLADADSAKQMPTLLIEKTWAVDN